MTFSPRHHCIFSLLLLFAFLIPGHARDFRVEMIPNAQRLPDPEDRQRGCIACHVASYPRESDENTERNAFGMAIEALVSQDGEEPFWGPELAAEDSDGDGYSNGVELGDPDGLELHRRFQIPLDELLPLGQDIRDIDDLAVGEADQLANPGLDTSVPPSGGGDPTATPTEAEPTPTLTETPAAPTATATPTITEVMADPTATPTSTLVFDKNEDQMIDVDDMIALLSDGMGGENWFHFAFRWNRPVE
jgi:hypothetical protein